MSTEEAAKPQVELAPLQKQNPKYYYWHSHEKERAAVGDVAPKATPQLLKSEVAPAGEPGTPAGSPILLAVPITKYSWCNNEKSVSVYVDFDGVEERSKADGAVTIEFTKRHLNVSIAAADGKQHKLTLRLSKEIDAAGSSYRFKPNQIVVKLLKPEGKTDTWFDLVDNKHTGGSDDDE